MNIYKSKYMLQQQHNKRVWKILPRRRGDAEILLKAKLIKLRLRASASLRLKEVHLLK